MINKNSLHRQFRRFHLLSKRIPLLIAANAEGILSKASLQKAQVQLKRLFQTLSPYFGQRRLRRVLGSAALVLGLHTAGNAQVAFTGPISNPFGLSSNTSSFILPKFADMDGDGDLDIMAMQDSSALAYYENTGTATNPQFAAAQWNPFNLAADTSGNYIYFSLGDIDNDGDFDMVAGRDSTGYLYFENIGTAFAANFAPPVLDTLGLDSASGSYYSTPTLVDIDSDGDLDIVSGTYYGAKIIHYVENTGTASNPHFEPRVNNPFGLVMLTDYWLPAFADLDRDGDLDVMAGVDNGNFFFQENVGTASSPLFVAGVNNPFGT
ncbi:MAG TPA: VCBS repeat-containing protein, partial [Bacteroidetes bacterium]|nr:VCBS repeat-containing protein [Bacteroidota bacterium]